MNTEILRKYASLAVNIGVAVKEDQLLVINAQVRDYEFVRLCVEEAYKAKAKRVIINWSDSDINHLDFLNCSTETLCDIPQYQYDARKYAQDNGCCCLSIASDIPGLLADVDSNKMKAFQKARGKMFADLMHYTMANQGQWCVIALPNKAWAKKVFPELDEQEAYDKLWAEILKTVKVNENDDPIALWQEHDAKLKKHCEILNDYNFKKLHFTNSLGTDLYVGLVKDHVWVGGSSETIDGTVFEANMPTEEVFCMPDKLVTSGVVYASKPLSYNGKLIDKFSLKFENGKVVEHHAEVGEDVLTGILESDEGSRYLGEVALISYDSPISLSNILYYETLFDENASCHLALGDSYPENVKGGTLMNEEQLKKIGANSSNEHVDFMFGTRDLNVTGIKENGEEIVVFKEGNFVF